MNDKDFQKMDEQWMKSAKDLREKKVSDGILKGFSASVERRIISKERSGKRGASPAWVPAMAILVIASVVVLRSPMLSTPVMPIVKTVDYAQLHDTDDVDDEIAALKEIGAWSDEDEALLGETDESGMEDLELSNLSNGQSNIA